MMPQANGAMMRVTTSVMTTPWTRPIRYCLKNKTSPMEALVVRNAAQIAQIKTHFFAPGPDENLSTHF